jgi:hypothetical protein
MYKINKNFLILISIIFLGIFYRLYQANFEDYWFDEYFGFWISDPSISFNETLKRNLGPELGQGQNIFFDFILKYFYGFVGYHPENGRYLTVFIGSISIPLLTYLSYQIDNSKSYLLTAFITSHCWYLISYSQEVRTYSFVFLLTILSFIFYIFLIKFNQKNPKKFSLSYLSYFLINLIGLINNIFFAIVIFSHFLYTLNYIDNKSKFKILLMNYVLVGSIFLILMFPSLKDNLSTSKFWISQVDFNFFISFFFPRFFGSKIMGYLYLFILIYLIIKSNNIIKKNSIYFLLFILLIISYLLPLIYSLIKIPILIDRYIIFVLVPIILLISIITFKQPTKIRNFIILLIVFMTFGNNYLEIFKRSITKPEFNNSLSLIANSDHYKIRLLAKNEINNEWLNNYLHKINFSKYQKLEFVDYNELDNDKHIWQLCYYPINNFNCRSNEVEENYNRIIDKSFYLVNASLFERK